MPVRPDRSPALSALKGKRLKFVIEYARILNARQAAIFAGYAPANADTQGAQLLCIPGIKAALEELKSRALVKADISQDRVLSEVAGLAFSDITDYALDVATGELGPAPGRPHSVMRAVASIKRKIKVNTDGSKEYEVEFRLWDKPGALKLAGRHVGLFPNRDQAAIEAAMEAALDKKIEAARQERARKLAEAENAAVERERRAIDVPTTGLPSDGQGGVG